MWLGQTALSRHKVTGVSAPRADPPRPEALVSGAPRSQLVVPPGWFHRRTLVRTCRFLGWERLSCFIFSFTRINVFSLLAPSLCLPGISISFGAPLPSSPLEGRARPSHPSPRVVYLGVWPHRKQAHLVTFRDSRAARGAGAGAGQRSPLATKKQP